MENHFVDDTASKNPWRIGQTITTQHGAAIMSRKKNDFLQHLTKGGQRLDSQFASKSNLAVETFRIETFHLHIHRASSYFASTRQQALCSRHGKYRMPSLGVEISYQSTFLLSCPPAP